MGIVLNWIGQGVMVAAAAGIGLWLMPTGRARARVRVWWTVVVTVLCLPLLSWWTANLSAPASVAALTPPLVPVPQAVWTATPVAVVLWVGWMAVHSLRLGLDLRALHRTRRHCRPLGPGVENRLRPSTRARLGKWGARLMVSADVPAAAMLGCGPPVIALHPALIERLTDSELDQVVVHEWAHVARRDGLGTLLQRLVNVLAGWHPAVWFALGRLHLEREMACDEVVVDSTGSAKAYAACLMRVAGLARTSRGSHLAVAMLSSAGLTCRVMRLLARRQTPACAPHWMMAPAALAVLVACGSGQVGLFGVRLDATALIDADAWTFLPTTAPFLEATRVAAPAVKRAARAGTASIPATAVAAPEAIAAVPAADPDTVADTVEPTGQMRELTAAPLEASSLLVPPATQPLAETPQAGESRKVGAEARDAWAAAAQAGDSIGRGSRKGAVATAGFFTRLSKKVATSF